MTVIHTVTDLNQPMTVGMGAYKEYKTAMTDTYCITYVSKPQYGSLAGADPPD